MLQEEQEQLTRNVGHVKEVINMQQGYGRASGYLESVAVPALVDDALRLNAVALLRNHIAVFRQYADGPPRLVDKNRVIQILVNLVQNASHALDGSDLEDKRLTVTVSYPAEDRIEVSVGDNGIGIPPENLTRIFSHGFSTREGGHGYGLHSGALAAKEMGGALSVLSDGLGKGALFTLTLPVIRPGSEEGGV